MTRFERLGRIAAKMKHPSMNVSHEFLLITDKAPDLDKKDAELLPLFPAVSVSPEADPQAEWLAQMRTAYRTGQFQ